MEKTVNFVSVATGLVISIANPVFFPFVVLVILNLIDYVTAIMSKIFNGEAVQSSVGIRGIFKKVSMWFMCGLTILLDATLKYYGLTLFNGNTLSVATVCWMIANEAISIIENIGKFGDHVPPFLYGMILKFKEWTEGKEDGHNNTMES